MNKSLLNLSLKMFDVVPKSMVSKFSALQVSLG